MAELHFGPSTEPPGDPSIPWYKSLNRYHWFVLIVASLGWLFDTMDQQLFALARTPAMRELLPRAEGEAAPSKEAIGHYGGLATAIFLLGWASGGIAFGIMGDRVGRAKTMLFTILLYSLCTGLSALSVGFWDFALYRFLTGLGVGGEFAVGVALVAEVMPERARPFALGLLQALSTVGNMTAAVIGMTLGHLESGEHFKDLMFMGWHVTPWRIMFVIGTIPALLAIVIRRNLKEPERWQELSRQRAEGKIKLGSFSELLGDPFWRKRAVVGLILASSGVIGLWGIGFFSYDLFQSVFRRNFGDDGLSPEQLEGKLRFWTGITSVMQNLGAFFGIWVFSRVTQRFGRRPVFAVAFIGAMISTAAVFWYLNALHQIFWLIPIMGFFQLALFGGYAIYFPELFPTRLRSTGTSFCYNVGRFVAAIGPFTFGFLTSSVFAGYDEPMRYAGVSMCGIFLIGLFVLPFAPETKGKPLPE